MESSITLISNNDEQITIYYQTIDSQKVLPLQIYRDKATPYTLGTTFYIPSLYFVYTSTGQPILGTHRIFMSGSSIPLLRYDNMSGALRITMHPIDRLFIAR